jgi:hypothetical protein
LKTSSELTGTLRIGKFNILNYLYILIHARVSLYESVAREARDATVLLSNGLAVSQEPGVSVDTMKCLQVLESSII